MVSKEDAERSVLRAILQLHDSLVFTAVLDDLQESVYRAYSDLLAPIEIESSQLDVLSVGNPLGSYARSAAVSEHRRLEIARKQLEYESCRDNWARRHRLTVDLTDTGECLPWVVEFALRSCESGRYILPPERTEPTASAFPAMVNADGRMLPPWHNPFTESVQESEGFTAWLKRVHSQLAEFHANATRRQFPAKNPKRKLYHYQAFVLRVCALYTYREIADRLDLRLEDDTVRKAFKTVMIELGLDRTTGNNLA